MTELIWQLAQGLPGTLIAAITAVLGAVVMLWRARVAGRKDERQKKALEAATGYANTRKAIDNADSQMGDDPAVLRDGLRKRDPGTK